MKTLIVLTLTLSAACSFDPGGLPADDAPDAAGEGDASAGADAGADADPSPDATPDMDAAPPAATVVCSMTSVDGYPKIVLTFGGDILSGFLGDLPEGDPSYIAYGSNQEDITISGACSDTWAIPYPVSCDKPAAAWGANPQLVLDPDVDQMNVALVYGDGNVFWGDLKTSDGDDVGFEVSGLDCRIELTGGGSGGYLRTHP